MGGGASTAIAEATTAVGEAVLTVDKKSAVSLGVIRLDYNYPPAPGDIDHPGSYQYDVFYRAVPGLTFEMCQSGKLSEEVETKFKEAIDFLEAKKVSGITGDCGFLMNYQKEARRQAKLPCFISAVMQCHILSCSFSVDEEFLVLTANGESLRPSFNKMLAMAHVTDPERQARFHVLGCENVDGFDAVAKGEKVDVPRVTPGIVKIASEAVAKNAKIRAILLECTELPPYADSLRRALKMPVRRHATLSNRDHTAPPRPPAAHRSPNRPS